MKSFRWIATLILVLQTAAAGAADLTIGVIMSGNVGYYQEVHKAFIAAMGREGFDHRKADTILQMPAPDMLSWANATRKLAVAEVNLIVTYGAPAAIAAIKETKGIPVVYAAVYDPPASGVSARNITGISSKVPMTSLLKYAKKLGPLAHIAVVYNEAEPDSVRQMEELRELEGQYGFQTAKLPVKKPEDVKKLIFPAKTDAAFITVSAVVNESLESVIQQARTAKIPTLSLLGGSADRGVILTLSATAQEQGEAAARIAARLLKGDNPASIPMEVPRLVELVLNLKEATALGIKPPIDLITDATKVIK